MIQTRECEVILAEMVLSGLSETEKAEAFAWDIRNLEVHCHVLGVHVAVVCLRRGQIALGRVDDTAPSISALCTTLFGLITSMRNTVIAHELSDVDNEIRYLNDKHT